MESIDGSTSPGAPDSSVPLLEGISREYLLHYGLCPVERVAGGGLLVAARDDCPEEALDDLSLVYGCEVVTRSIKPADLDQLIERVSTRSSREVEIERGTSSGLELAADARDLANQPPVVRYVNLLIRDAYDAQASDIHLESTPIGLVARFRVDGVLVSAPEAASDLHFAIISRIKLLAELDISDRRRPQDGRIRVRLESRELDLRVSTVPTIHGESVVLRLLARGGRPTRLDELDMPEEVHIPFAGLARRPHGILLVTGPTGSGKTTTLYAALGLRDATTEKIITVEDPIEYQLTGVTQVPVHRQAGITFGSALRSILRQDPDVVMVGEMRDPETAEVAIQAALTGHLVLSTLHTNDSLGALPRLLDLGIPPYLISATLDGILAQRLVRRTCDTCRESYSPGEDVLMQIAPGEAAASFPGTLTRGSGCPSCRGTGFRGRLGIYEFLPCTEEIRSAISSAAPRDVLSAAGARARTRSLREDGWAKAKRGLTTVEEVLRVVQADS